MGSYPSVGRGPVGYPPVGRGPVGCQPAYLPAYQPVGPQSACRGPVGRPYPGVTVYEVRLPVTPPLQLPLLPFATGGFPVPESVDPEDLPPAVKEAILRPLEGPPKPSVSKAVMEQTQSSMIEPALPFAPKV